MTTRTAAAFFRHRLFEAAFFHQVSMLFLPCVKSCYIFCESANFFFTRRLVCDADLCQLSPVKVFYNMKKDTWNLVAHGFFYNNIKNRNKTLVLVIPPAVAVDEPNCNFAREFKTTDLIDISRWTKFRQTTLIKIRGTQIIAR